MKRIFLVTLIATFCFSAEIEIPRSMADKGKYYLLDIKKDGDYIQATHKRVGVDSLGFSLTKIDCKNYVFQDLGYGEDSVNNIKPSKYPQWTNVVIGSSKSDLIKFVCLKYK